MVHVEGFHAKSKYHQDFDYKVAIELRYFNSFAENTLYDKVMELINFEYELNESD